MIAPRTGVVKRVSILLSNGWDYAVPRTQQCLPFRHPGAWLEYQRNGLRFCDGQYGAVWRLGNRQFLHERHLAIRAFLRRHYASTGGLRNQM